MCVCHGFFFLCIVDRCRSLNFPLVFLVINGGDLVLSRVRSKKQPPSLLSVSVGAVGMLFARLPCVWEPQAQVPSPSASVENGECSWIRDFYTWVCASLLGLEWSKTSMFHFAQSLASHPLSRVKSMAESFTLKPQKTNPTPVACESYLQRPGNSQDVVYEAHSQSGLLGVASSLASFPATCEHQTILQRERGMRVL